MEADPLSLAEAAGELLFHEAGSNVLEEEGGD